MLVLYTLRKTMRGVNMDYQVIGFIAYVVTSLYVIYTGLQYKYVSKYACDKRPHLSDQPRKCLRWFAFAIFLFLFVAGINMFFVVPWITK